MNQVWKYCYHGWQWFRLSTSRRIFSVVILLFIGYLAFVWLTFLATLNLALSLTISAPVLAAFVALFMDAFKTWIWRPELSISYVHNSDFCDKAVMRGKVDEKPFQFNCYYFRLLIANKGTRRAEKVEVLGTDLRSVDLTEAIHFFDGTPSTSNGHT